ncbi:Trichothecene 3-O-acetyltransferase TRI101 [Colletotrichum sp. SAR 10_70]|nr:Trichothecene 3-O-acetyltransferase TRI101 [Colletotrichum sp. SAR 10_71]KAI8199851.1 Trichothecene 3-O-acetyltransferase TRI101 [Colletotrichum sp. SAR 10_70]KAI8207386.1 Trichothecene 3-O-acetyltransferase TRI101 [Colletotrichum sp. SAR 10_65]
MTVVSRTACEQLEAEAYPGRLAISAQDYPGPEVFHVEDRKIPVTKPFGKITVRIYSPEGPGPFPVHLNFHGGGWVLGGLQSEAAWCRHMCNKANIKIIDVDYRMGPEHKFPTAIYDCWDAVKWTISNAQALNIDPTSVSFGGLSAGGQMSAVLAHLARDEKIPIKLHLMIVPATDMRYCSRKINGLNEINYEQERCLNEWILTPVLAPNFSDLPPAHIVTAEFDVERDEGEQFGGRLQINDQTGQYTIKATDNDVVELSVKYHNEPEDDYVPSYYSLEMEAFPPMLLDSKKLLPRTMTEKQTLTQHGDFLEDDAPVTMFMVTFIRGGLVLGVGLHHLATDVSGLDGFLQSWAANNRNLVAGLPLAPFDYSIMDRALLTHSDTLPDVERWTELDQKLKTVKLLDAAPQAPPPEFKMPATSEVLFHFPKSKTDQLKSAASSTDPDTWVSSFDSIMALCWRCVSRARQSSSSGDTTTTLMFAVNGRGRLKPQLARHYVGNVAMLSRSELTFDEVVAPDAFPRLAALVRAANVEVDDNLYKSVVEWVAGVPDKRRIGLNMNAFLGPDVVSSSWQGLSAHQTWDFGFGTPKAIRWPKPDLDGFVFYFPSRNAGDPDEGVEMVVCLEDSAMQKLLKDQEWLRFETLIGLSG